MFSPDASESTGLDLEERRRFQTDGWLGPYPLLSRAGLDVARRHAEAPQWPVGLPPAPWFKSLHASIPELRTIASHPAIVNRVAAILGPELLLWGTSVVAREPGQKHRWHVDVEHTRWHGVTAFVGLEHLSAASSLRVVSGSHGIDVLPQSLRIENDAQALASARLAAPASQLVTLDMRDGEFVLMEGRLWHGSHNQTSHTRLALLAQYSAPSADIAIPLTFNEPVRWHHERPPCVRLSAGAT